MRIKYVITLLTLISILTGQSNSNKAAKPERGELYTIIGQLYGYRESPIIKPGVVMCYDSMDWDIRDTINAPGDWKGEKYEVREYRWKDSSFVFERRYYTNETGKKQIHREDYDYSRTRNLELPEVFFQIPQMAFIAGMRTTKAYAEGDFNSDGRKDLVIVMGDTTRAKYPKFIDYYLEIWEQKNDGGFSRKFRYDFSDIDVGKVTIQDATGDGRPEVILWTFSGGASGWTEFVDIFSRVKDK